MIPRDEASQRDVERRKALDKLANEVEEAGLHFPQIIPGESLNRDEAHAALQRIRTRAEQSKLGHFDWPEWKAYRDEGRP
jgi:hypothetical protein